MKRRLSVIALLALAVASMSFAADAPAEVEGTWKFSASVAPGRNVVQNFVIKQEGAKITGTFAPEGNFVGTDPLEGRIEGNNISFKVTTSSGTDDYEGRLTITP